MNDSRLLVHGINVNKMWCLRAKETQRILTGFSTTHKQQQEQQPELRSLDLTHQAQQEGRRRGESRGKAGGSGEKLGKRKKKRGGKKQTDWRGRVGRSESFVVSRRLVACAFVAGFRLVSVDSCFPLCLFTVVHSGGSHSTAGWLWKQNGVGRKDAEGSLGRIACSPCGVFIVVGRTNR